MNFGSPPRLLLPHPVVSPCLGKGLSPSLCMKLYPPGTFVSRQLGSNCSLSIQATEPPCHLFDTLTGSPLLPASCTTEGLDNLRIIQETHACFVKATALPTPAYAAADLDLMNVWITNHLIPFTAQGHLSYLRQRNIYLEDVPYTPNSRLPMLNQIACAELDLAMDEASRASQPSSEWGQPPP